MQSFGFVFPGQGSQSVGMISDILHKFPNLKHFYAEASEYLGYNLWTLIEEGPLDALSQTEYTQPALLVSAYVVWLAIQQEKKVMPMLIAGHSLGEYTALLCAGAFTFKDAVTIVSKRGKWMQEAVPMGEGALAVIIGLSDDIVSTVCEHAALSSGEVVTPANFNCEGQVVIAGETAAIHRAMELAKEAGARLVKTLTVSVPSHCKLMEPAGVKLKALLDTMEIKSPKFPVINNVAVEEYTSPSHIRAGLVKQLSNPVRWVETIQLFERKGVKTIVECGPGKVLTGLNKRITQVTCMDIQNATQLQHFLDC